jgi:hypothetical protein
LFKTHWQAVDHQLGIPWNLESLKEHASRIECGLVDLSSVQEVCGVKEQPLFDVMDTDHYILHVLHLTIGKGNDLLNNFIVELQTAGEAYSEDYYKTERDVRLVILSHEKPKEELQQFNDSYKE